MSKLQERESRRRGAVGSMIAQAPAAGETAGGREHKKRFCLALRPSVYGDVQSLAYAQRKSASQVIEELLEGYVQENRKLLDEFRRLEQ